MIELLKEALETIKTLKEYCESDDPGLEIGAPVVKKLEEAIKNGSWRGLTDEERGQVINANFGTGLWQMAKDLEAKLKEKNNA